VRTLLEVVVAQQLDVGVAHLVDEAEHGGRRALPQPALLLLLETGEGSRAKPSHCEECRHSTHTAAEETSGRV
jgi:hypothetical protein